MWSRSLALALLLLPAPALAGVKENVAALAPQGWVLVTASLAMEVLGGDYRFKTRFYLDDKRVLYVRGGGDSWRRSRPSWSRRSARSRSQASCWTRAITL